MGWQPGDNYRVFAHGLMLFSDSFTHVCDVEGKQDDGTQARLRYCRGAKTLVSACLFTSLLTVRPLPGPSVSASGINLR